MKHFDQTQTQNSAKYRQFWIVSFELRLNDAYAVCNVTWDIMWYMHIITPVDAALPVIMLWLYIHSWVFHTSSIAKTLISDVNLLQFITFFIPFFAVGNKETKTENEIFTRKCLNKLPKQRPSNQKITSWSQDVNSRSSESVGSVSIDNTIILLALNIKIDVHLQLF